MRSNGAEKELSLMDVLPPPPVRRHHACCIQPHKQGYRQVYGISAHTVSHHLSNIFERVGCGNRTELTVRYVHEQNKGLYSKKEFSERLAQLRKAARSNVMRTSRQRIA